MSDLSHRLASFITIGEVEPACRTQAAVILSATAQRASTAGEDPAVSGVIDALDVAEDGRATPLGRRFRVSVPAAALITGVAADRPGDGADTRAATAVAAAATATAEARRVAGRLLIDAIAVGVEVAVRFGEGLAASGYAANGWDPVGATGAIGATGAVARLLGSDVATTQQSLGVAATQAAGLAIARGTSTWSLHVGKAAANGAEAALLCAEGFSGPSAGIEGRRGLIEVAAPGTDSGAIVAGLGEVWRSLASPLAAGAPRGAVHDVVSALARSEATVSDLVAACATGHPRGSPSKPAST